MTVDDFGNWDPGPLEPGERLFIDSGGHREIAMIDYSLTEDRYIVSYRKAGEVLTTHVLKHGMQDLLVFPILFAYRHWLELQLKSIITLGQRWRGERPEPVHTHKLEVLCPIARKAIETAFPDDPADLDTAASIVDDLVAVDPESISFRYARNRKGQVTLPRGLERVNVAHIASVMLQVGLLLDGAADAMADMLATPRIMGHRSARTLLPAFERAGLGARVRVRVRTWRARSASSADSVHMNGHAIWSCRTRGGYAALSQCAQRRSCSTLLITRCMVSRVECRRLVGAGSEVQQGLALTP